MPENLTPEALAAQHTHDAIAKRIAATAAHSYVGDFVLGAIDGTVTTFAIVAGVAGAGLSGGVALVLGLANVLADGFSMAASNYLKAQSDQQMVDRFRRLEELHIDRVPEAEKEEIRQIFAAKGFDGELLENVVNVITGNRRQWVNTMLTEEWGLPLESPRPLRASLSTFAAFLLAGMVPLVPLIFADGASEQSVFVASTIATLITFFCIGMAKGKVVSQSPLWGGVETVLVGGSAAAMAYFVSALLRDWVGGQHVAAALDWLNLWA